MHPDEIRQTIGVLRRAFESGESRELSWRQHQLRALRALLVECETELVQALRDDVGKPALEAHVSETGFLVAEVDFALGHLARWAKSISVDTPLPYQVGASRVEHAPLGVVLIIGPWNYPLQLVLGPLVTGFTGLRGFTVTAWEDEASMKRALGGHHAVAMKELFAENFVASVWTSVWTPTRMNRIWVRCPACGSLEDVNDDHRSCRKCLAAMPERPAFW